MARSVFVYHKRCAKQVCLICELGRYGQMCHKMGNFLSSVFLKYVYPFFTCRKSANNKVCGGQNGKNCEKFFLEIGRFLPNHF